MSRQQRRYQARKGRTGKSGHTAHSIDPDDPRLELVAEAHPFVARFCERTHCETAAVAALAVHPEHPLFVLAPLLGVVDTTATGARVVVVLLQSIVEALMLAGEWDVIDAIVRTSVRGASCVVAYRRPGEPPLVARCIAVDRMPVGVSFASPGGSA